MKVRRSKNHRRILRFFRLSFGVQDPYRVLVDGTFLTHALQHKVHVKEQLPKILAGRATPMVTSCVLAELRSLGDRALGAAIIAKGYYRLKCGHGDDVAAARCICEQIGKKNDRKLFVATQDQELLHELRSVPGVPVLRLDGPVPRLEEPSPASRAVASATEAKKLNPSDWELRKLPELRARQAEAAAKAAAGPKKRKGPKGPNPLSCKKPQKRQRVDEPGAARAVEDATAGSAPAETATKPKRVRSRRMNGTRTLDANQGGPKTSASPGAPAPATSQENAAPVASEKTERARSRRAACPSDAPVVQSHAPRQGVEPPSIPKAKRVRSKRMRCATKPVEA